jgi:predicted hotdog family 3-hydroxylacyl-ACP dehydratase
MWCYRDQSPRTWLSSWIASMLDKSQLGALIPHAGSMCLLDAVEDWTGDGIRCSSYTHRDPANPLRSDGVLAALHLVEYAAQAMAAHGALLAQGGPQTGMLGALRDVRLYANRLDDLPAALIVNATRRLARSDGLIYDFTVHLQGSPVRLLSEGRISVVLYSQST